MALRRVSTFAHFEDDPVAAGAEDPVHHPIGAGDALAHGKLAWLG
jgi:hypothetical protein